MTMMILKLARAKGTNSLRRNVPSILSFKQFANLEGRNRMQKKQWELKNAN